ncbi:MAG: RT0821/Lpp0805 family surface protein [Nitrosospira sp.]|nr:RT0821/Lpp0805 family surface protein [Nitrosospira sp.]
MILRKTLTLLCVLFASGWVATATAQNVWWMHDMPGAYFNDQDRKLYNEIVIDLLDKGESGAHKEWKNEASRNGGEVTVTDSTRKLEGNQCRYLKISNYAYNGLKETTRREACKRADGHWAIIRVVP